jgi:hypothetical protein
MNTPAIELRALIAKVKQDSLHIRDERFPHDDCVDICMAAGFPAIELITELDLYLADIAGYASWGYGLLHWPLKKLQEARKRLEPSVFDIYPFLGAVRHDPGASRYRALHRELTQHENIRLKLLQILNTLEASAVDPSA